MSAMFMNAVLLMTRLLFSINSMISICVFSKQWLLLSVILIYSPTPTASNCDCTDSFPTLEYKGKCYATIGGESPYAQTIGCERDFWYTLPSGWQIAESTSDTVYVSNSYPWGTHVLVFGYPDVSGIRGTSWEVSTEYSTSSSFSSTWYVTFQSPDKYKTNNCHLRVLISKSCITTTTTTTMNPTASPTYKSCVDQGEIKSINWNELQNSNDNSAEVPYYDFNISFNSNTLELTFDTDLEYVGLSTDGNFDNTYNLGTTYIIDFQSFGTNGDHINKPGNCQNRLASSFNDSKDFNTFWGFSVYPYLSDELGSNLYLSYPPPSKYWTLNIDDNGCTPINYKGVFTWKQLSKCTDYNGNKLINIMDNNRSITLSGTLYVNLVSPYSMSVTDTGVYRTFPLIQQDFEISVSKPINILSSTGVKLFIISIISIYEDETDGSFKLSVLTESADYIKLINPNILSTPIQISGSSTITSISSSCLVASSFTCGQIFTLSMDKSQINCPPADFSGDYQFEFDVICRGNESVCNSFIDDNNGSMITLQVTSNFIDTTCESKLYQVIFDGNIQFYDDEEFNIIHIDPNGDNGYVIGQDIIYVQVEVNLPYNNNTNNSDDFNIYGVIIDNVFVCTVDSDADITVNLDQHNGNGGCLSSSIDADGPYHIITNGVPNINYNAEIITSNGNSNIVQFSFLAFDIGRNTLYVHTQLTLVLKNKEKRRRLQPLQTDNNNNDDSNSNQIRHFIYSTSMIAPYQNSSNEKGVVYINISIIVFVCLCIIFVIIMGIWYYFKKNLKMNNKSDINKREYHKPAIHVNDNEIDDVLEEKVKESMQNAQQYKLNDESKGRLTALQNNDVVAIKSYESGEDDEDDEDDEYLS